MWSPGTNYLKHILDWYKRFIGMSVLMISMSWKAVFFFFLKVYMTAINTYKTCCRRNLQNIQFSIFTFNGTDMYDDVLKRIVGHQWHQKPYQMNRLAQVVQLAEIISS